MINEETGQIFYYLPGGIGLVAYKQGLEIPIPKIIKPKEKHTATLIFLHGTYGVGSLDQMAEKFPGLKVIHPHSPTIQYDMWHGSQPAPGGQCQGWINITGDAWELMEADVIPTNQSRKKIKEADQIIHLDYHQLRRATNYINEIIEREIANGLPSEKIIIAGYSQGGLLTLATALTSPHKLGGFVSLCGFLPCWDKLLIKTKNLNQKTPCLIINNTKDTWIPFWTGQKTYEILKERGYKVEFKTHPCLGHNWKNEDVEEFLEKTLTGKGENYQTKDNFIENRKNTAKKAIIVVGAIGGGIILLFIIIKLIIWRTIKK